MILDLYNYEAIVKRVIDGDTIDLTIKIGFYLKYDTPVRLLDINTPEIRGIEKPQGLISKSYVEEVLPIGKNIEIHTEKDDVFGRWLGVIHYLNDDGEALNLNCELLELGLAEQDIR